MIPGLENIAGLPTAPPVEDRRHCPDTRPVRPPTPAAERRAREDVRARLARRFPEIPAQVLEQIVAEEFGFFADAPVRHYVPVLVLRRAGERLSRLGRTDPVAPSATNRDA